MMTLRTNKRNLILIGAIVLIIATLLLAIILYVQKFNDGIVSMDAINGDMFASDGQYVYYSMNGITRINPKGLDKKELSDDNAYPFLAVDGWLYYGNFSDNQKLYKMKSDGTNKTKLNDFPIDSISVYDDEIFFSNAKYSSRVVRLYRMKKIDSKITELNINVESYGISDGWIYYSNRSDNESLYKMKVDGSNNSKIYNGICKNSSVVGRWIYFSGWNNLSGDTGIYKIDTNGSHLSKIYNEPVGPFKVLANWIYYIKPEPHADYISGSIYKIQSNGSNNTKVINDPDAMEISIIGDQLYYDSFHKGAYDTTEYITAGIDGSNKKIIDSVTVEAP